MLPTGETTSPRSKFPGQPQSINQLWQRSLTYLCWRAYPNGTSSTRLFFEIALGGQTKFKDADAVANAMGCAPLPEILIQNFLIAWLEHGLRYPPAKTALTEPNRSVSPSLSSASVTRM